MSLVNAEAIGSTKNAVVRRQFYFIAYNGSQVYLVADLVTQNFKFRRNEERRTKLE